MLNAATSRQPSNRVQSIRRKFENLSSIEPLDILPPDRKPKPKPVFVRSHTAFNLLAPSTGGGGGGGSATVTREAAQTNGGKEAAIKNLLRGEKPRPAVRKSVSVGSKENAAPVRPTHLPLVRDPVKRSSIKRTPAFRVGDKTPAAVAKTSPPVKKNNGIEDEFQRALKRNEAINLTDTLKKALKQPLPKGPPPKKPPRAFEATKEVAEPPSDLAKLKTKVLRAEQRLRNGAESTATKASKTKETLLGCFGCVADTPVYDVTPASFDDILLKTFPSQGAPRRSSEPPVYMEPFGHLRVSRSNGCKAAAGEAEPSLNSFGKTLPKESPATSLRSSSSGGGGGAGGDEGQCACPIGHGGATPTGDLHYMCTAIQDTFAMPPTPPPSSSTAGGETNSSSDEQSLSLSSINTYDQINLLVDAAFQEPKMTVEPEKAPAKVSRSLTEKRKDYVRRVSSAHKRPSIPTYGTISRSFKAPVALLAPDDDETTPVESTSDRINKYKQLIESQNAAAAASSSSPSRRDAAPAAVARPLFRLCLLVGFNISTNQAYVKWRFPPDEEVPENIENLVFPTRDMLQRRPDGGQDYSLVLTDETGRRFYGYCRRVLPESSDVFLPLSYCLVSEVLAPGFYFKVLREIESRHGHADGTTTALLRTLQTKPIPEPGKFLHFKLPLSPRPKTLCTAPKASPKRLSLEANPKWLADAQRAAPPFDLGLINRSLDESRPDEVFIRRPNDLRLESTELGVLFASLGTELLLHVFGSLLLERKVILCGADLAQLSACILGLHIILYPFQWPHTLVTVLPEHLVEVCHAPFPVLAGTLSAITTPIDDAIVIDLETRAARQRCGDESTLLPDALRQSLAVSLEMVDLLDHGKMLSSVLIGEAFLRFFVELFEDLDFAAFDKDAFIQSRLQPSVRLFLEWFTETAMFRHFVASEAAADEPAFYALFNAKLHEKCENRTKTSQNMETIMRNCRILNRKARTFKDRVREIFSHSSSSSNAAGASSTVAAATNTTN